MENIDFASNGIEELKNTSGEVQELRFKVRFLSLLGKVIKNIFLFIIIFIAIIFSFFTLYSAPFFLFIILLAINKRTIVVTKDGKTHKLIKYVLNEMALKDLANEINHHMSLKV